MLHELLSNIPDQYASGGKNGDNGRPNGSNASRSSSSGNYPPIYESLDTYCDCPPDDVQLVHTNSYVVCNTCGVCIDTVYDDLVDINFETVAEHSQPEWNDDRRAIDAITDLINWYGGVSDISIGLKKSMIEQTTMVAKRLKDHDITYPSPYYIAASIIFADQFSSAGIKSCLEQLIPTYTTRVRRMLKKSLQIMQYYFNETENGGFTTIRQFRSYTNSYVPSYYNDYYSKKIAHIDSVRKRYPDRSISDICEMLNFPSSTYYHVKRKMKRMRKKNGKYTLQKKPIAKSNQKITLAVSELIRELYTSDSNGGYNFDGNGSTREDIAVAVAEITRQWWGPEKMVVLDQRTVSYHLETLGLV